MFTVQRASPEPVIVDTLMLDSQTPELVENNISIAKTSHPWYFIMTDLSNQYKVIFNSS